MFNKILIFVLSLIPLCTISVHNIECIPNNSVKVSFAVEGASNTDKVYFTLNNKNYRADRESSNIFSKNISVTFPYTGTVTSAFLLSDNNKYYADNVPFTKYLNCTPTNVNLVNLQANSNTSHGIVYFLIVSLLVGFIILFIKSKK